MFSETELILLTLYIILIIYMTVMAYNTPERKTENFITGCTSHTLKSTCPTSSCDWDATRKTCNSKPSTCVIL